MKNNNTINKLLEELADLQQAKELLEEVWIELGPYKLPDSLKVKLQRYFNFNDSE